MILKGEQLRSFLLWPLDWIGYENYVLNIKSVLCKDSISLLSSTIHGTADKMVDERKNIVFFISSWKCYTLCVGFTFENWYTYVVSQKKTSLMEFHDKKILRCLKV